MKVYFLSAQPSELTLNGVFFGIVDSFERFAEVNLSDEIFAKFTPQGALPVGVFLNDELLRAPPEGVEIYLLKDGIALYIKEFPPSDFILVPIAQARFENALISVFRQGKVQVSLQTEEGFFTSTLPPSFASCSLSYHAGLFFIHTEKQLAIYTKSGKQVFLEEIAHFEVEGNTLNATLPLSDSFGRIADCTWTLDENGITQTQFLLRQTRSQPENGLLAYAFLESVLLGADYKDFLSEELKPSADRIKDFLGEFQAVTLTADPYVCGIVKPKAKRVFELTYITVTVENNKIIDINW